MKNETPQSTPQPTEKKGILRREFFNIISAGAIFSSIVGSLITVIQFLTPNVLLEPSSTFKLGKPEEYPEGSVTFYESRKVFILREKGGFRVASAVCTHLGCTNQWQKKEEHFFCPCHGAVFDRDGNVLAGPAPRPIDWFKVSLALNGRLVVDASNIVGPDYLLTI